MEKKKGKRIFIECLQREGVEVVFGHPGGVVLGVYDLIYDKPFIHILMRHEQAAAHAADGYARATGKVGVCFATSGPGATNLVTGIASANMDSVAMVALTGQVPSQMIGADAFQEADIIGITRPITKHSYMVRSVEDMPRVIHEAFYIAGSGRPGPVLVDLPKDLWEREAEADHPTSVDIPGYKPTVSGNMGQVKKASGLLMQAKKPVLYAGGGVLIAGATPELVRLAEMLNIPCTTTLQCMGGFPGDHPLYLGMLGMHGTYYANMAVHNSDVLIAVGARFDDRVTGKIEEFAPSAQIIHIDIDPAAISKNVHVHVPIVGDAKDVLTKLLNELQKVADSKWEPLSRVWLKQIQEWKNAYPLEYTPSAEEIKPQYVIQEIARITGGKAIVSVDVGQHQMWTAQYYPFLRPRTFLSSSGLGAMGYGFPAALGAQVAFPEELVVCIAGDGSIQMMLQELSTCVQYNLPVKVAIINNKFLGMVRQWQEMFYNLRYSESSLEVAPDFVRLAEAYGAKGFRAEKPEEVRPVLEEGLNTPGPVVMDFLVAREENVFPMVPPGAGIADMLLEKPKKAARKLVGVRF